MSLEEYIWAIYIQLISQIFIWLSKGQTGWKLDFHKHYVITSGSFMFVLRRCSVSHVCSPQNIICSSVKSFGQCQLKVLTLGTADLTLLVLVPRMQSCSAVLGSQQWAKEIGSSQTDNPKSTEELQICPELAGRKC